MYSEKGVSARPAKGNSPEIHSSVSFGYFRRVERTESGKNKNSAKVVSPAEFLVSLADADTDTLHIIFPCRFMFNLDFL